MIAALIGSARIEARMHPRQEEPRLHMLTIWRRGSDSQQLEEYIWYADNEDGHLRSYNVILWRVRDQLKPLQARLSMLCGLMKLNFTIFRKKIEKYWVWLEDPSALARVLKDFLMTLLSSSSSNETFQTPNFTIAVTLGCRYGLI